MHSGTQSSKKEINGCTKQRYQYHKQISDAKVQGYMVVKDAVLEISTLIYSSPVLPELHTSNQFYHQVMLHLFSGADSLL